MILFITTRIPEQPSFEDKKRLSMKTRRQEDKKTVKAQKSCLAQWFYA